MVPGGYTRVGNTGTPSTLLEEVPTPAKRAPEAQHGLEWVGVGAGRTGDGGGDGQEPTPAGPGRSPPGSPPWFPPLQIAASQPIRARFRLYFCKVSQNGQVSPENV